MKLENKPYSDFGRSIKKKLVENNKNQNWLLDELRKRLPDMYIDSSLIHKIIVGEVSSGRVVEEIHNIFEI